MLSIVLPSPETVLDENPERLADYKVLSEGRKPNIIQTLMEKLSESSYLLREAINKQVFIETIMLKSMRAAHSIPVESLIARLNQIRRTGELAGIEKVPTLAGNPVETPAAASPVPPPAVSPIPAEKKTADRIENIAPAQVSAPPAVSSQEISVKQEEIKEEIKEETLEEKQEEKEEVKEEVKTSPPPVEENFSIKDEKSILAEAPSPASAVSAATTFLPASAEISVTNEETVKEEVKEEKIYFDGTASSHPQQIWEALSAMARKEKKISLAELILLGVPQKIENNELIVAFDQEYGETALAAVCSEIYFLMEKLSAISPLAEFRFLRLAGIRSFTGAVREKALDDLKKEVSNNETVLMTNDLFGGKIIDVLEDIQNETPI